MSGEPRDDDFVSQVRAALDDVVLAPALAARLATARRRAVAAVDLPVARTTGPWLPVGALATTLLVVALGVSFDGGGTPPLDDEAQLAAVEDLDLLQDLEFVAWLNTDNVDG
jgi:hypothetical protein